jgi:hypothetical protein
MIKNLQIGMDYYAATYVIPNDVPFSGKEICKISVKNDKVTIKFLCEDMSLEETKQTLIYLNSLFNKTDLLETL